MAYINDEERTELAESIKSNAAAIFFFHLLRKGMCAVDISDMLYKCFQQQAVDISLRYSSFDGEKVVFTPPHAEHQTEIDNLFAVEFDEGVAPPQNAVFDNDVDSMATGHSHLSVPEDMREIDNNVTATTLISRSRELLQRNDATGVPPQGTGA